MSLIEDEKLDEELSDDGSDEAIPSFNRGRPELVDAMVKASPLSDSPEYWVGVHHALAARLRHEGVNRPMGAKRPSVEDFYSKSASIVYDVHGVLARLAEKARNNLGYLEKNRPGLYAVRSEQHRSVMGKVLEGRLGPCIEGTGRTAFEGGLANCHEFLRKELRAYHAFYASRRAQQVLAASSQS